MRSQRAAVLGMAAMLAACEQQQPTEVVAGSTVGAMRAASDDGVADQSYDVTIESTRDGAKPATQRFHVDRYKTGGGWKTRLVMTPDERLAGTGSYDLQVGSIEIDESGNRQSLDRRGREIVSRGSDILEDASARARLKYPDEIARHAGKRPRPALANAGKQAFDLLNGGVRSRTQRDGDMKALRARHGAAKRDPIGREHFTLQVQGGSVDIAADPGRGVVTEVVRATTGAKERVQYEYAADGELTIRRKVRYLREKSGTSPASSVTVTLSRITINGKEINP